MIGWDRVAAAAEAGSAVAVVVGADVVLSGVVVRDEEGVYRVRPRSGADVLLLRVGGAGQLLDVDRGGALLLDGVSFA